MTDLFTDPTPNPASDAPDALATWRDPNPAPVLDVLPDGTQVVRDDLLPGGTKRRALDYLIGHDPTHAHITDWVYGSSPAHGYAQWALSLVCRDYGKHAHLFMAARDLSKLHRVQQCGLDAGGRYYWIPNGMLSVTQKRARDYVAASPTTRALLPLGGNVPSALTTLTRVARSLPLADPPEHIWSVLSSGTLSRALQAAYPNAMVHGVVVGHTPTPDEAGRAHLYRSPYPFARPVRPADAPPYPSVAEYDAKLWPCYRAWRASHPSARVLIWNVGA